MIEQILFYIVDGSYLKIVSVRSTCHAPRILGSQDHVHKVLLADHIPLFVVENNPFVSQIISLSCTASYLSAMFRLGLVHYFCKLGDFAYGRD